MTKTEEELTLRLDIINNFEFMNVENLEDPILDKCVEICLKHGLNGENFVEEWLSYTASFLQGQLPTIDALQAMERKKYGVKKPKQSSHQVNVQNIAVELKNNLDKPDGSLNIQDGEAEMLIEEKEDNFTQIESNSTVSTPRKVTTSKTFQDNVKNKHEVTSTPRKATTSKTFQDNIKIKHEVTEPLEDSFAAMPSQTMAYDARTNKGNILLTSGPDILKKKATFKSKNRIALNIRLYEKHKALPSEVLYMNDVLKQKQVDLVDITDDLGLKLLKKYDMGDPQSFLLQTASMIPTYGRITYNEFEGNLDADNIYLEGTLLPEIQGKTIQLDISRLNSFAFFPGQVVAMEGINVGKKFAVRNVYSDFIQLLLEPTEEQKFSEPLQLVVACGPFTLSENILYQPLNDLIAYVIENKPHILILIGPFLDQSHTIFNEGFVTKPYNEIFEDLIKSIMEPLNSLEIEVILISSQKDIHHQLIYPTPQYTVGGKYKNLHCYQDPSLININGLVIGATSVDILLHLGKEESSGCIKRTVFTNDRISRLISHLLNQRSFYPLCPPDEDTCVDYGLLQQFGSMSVTPHILILPSNFKYFVKTYGGCVVINPERLTKGNFGGTFAKLEIHPGSIHVASEFTVCEIVNI